VDVPGLEGYVKLQFLKDRWWLSYGWWRGFGLHDRGLVDRGAL
jgi:hypothetical protein